MKKLWSVVVALVFCALTVLSAQEKYAGGILYGANWGCAVTAPDDWIMDQTTWAANNIYALFYQKDQKFGPSIPIVYVNTTQLHAATDDELGVYVDWDVSNLKKDPLNTVSEVNLGTLVNQKVRCFSINYNNKQFETVAYLRYKDTCFLVVLATHDKTQVAPTMPKFKDVIRSMKFMDKS